MRGITPLSVKFYKRQAVVLPICDEMFPQLPIKNFWLKNNYFKVVHLSLAFKNYSTQKPDIDCDLSLISKCPGILLSLIGLDPQALLNRLRLVEAHECCPLVARVETVGRMRALPGCKMSSVHINIPCAAYVSHCPPVVMCWPRRQLQVSSGSGNDIRIASKLLTSAITIFDSGTWSMRNRGYTIIGQQLGTLELKRCALQCWVHTYRFEWIDIYDWILQLT